jgi:type I restriction enzyme, S subunit
MKAISASPANLPPSWMPAPLGELGYWCGGGTPSKSNNEYWQNGTIPWVSPKDMKVSKITGSYDYITPRAVAESATSLVPAGAVLMVVRSGILRHTFPVAVARVDVALNQDMKALVPFDGVDSYYVAAALRAFGDEILHVCAKSGTTVNSIEFPRLKSYNIPLAPRLEQIRIVSRLDELLSQLDAGLGSLARVIKLVGASSIDAQSEISRAEGLRRAILRSAFSGKLVSEVSGDESATALLEGIRMRKAERLKSVPNKQRQQAAEQQLDLLS